MELIASLQAKNVTGNFLLQNDVELSAKGKPLFPAAGEFSYEKEPLGFECTNADNNAAAVIQKIHRPSELIQLGYVCVSMRAEKKFYVGNKMQWRLIPAHIAYERYQHLTMYDRTSFPVDYLNRRAYVEYDITNNRIRLIGLNAGPSGYSEWISIGKKRQEFGSSKNLAYNSYFLPEYRSVIKSEFQKEAGVYDRVKKVTISEIPFMITAFNHIVCIPKRSDAPTVCVVGKRGSGKSYTMSSLASHAFWQPSLDIRIGFINDSTNETVTFPYPNQNPEDIIKIKNRFSIPPKPLPVAFLYPHENPPPEIIYENTLAYEISLDYHAVLAQPDKFFDMGKSGKYFSSILDNLKKCRTEQSIIDTCSHLKNEMTKDKVIAMLQEMFDREILDLSTGIPSKWKVTLKRKGIMGEYTPFLACLLAGIVPVLKTNSIIHKQWFSMYFQSIAEEIFFTMNQEKLFRSLGIQAWLFIDELLSITKKSKAGTLAVEQLVTEGRPKGIGTVFATQNYSHIPERIRTNAGYIITTNNQEAAEIVRDFNLPKYMTETIRSLKKHEVVAATTEEFVCYSPDGLRYTTDDPIQGKILPPLLLHKLPDTVIQEGI